MAYLISRSTGNFTAASTWGLVDSTSLLDSTSGYTALNPDTDYNSQTFTPGAVTVDGLAIRVYNNTASSGTVTVTLWNSTDGAAVASVTANLASLGNDGWHFFKFGSPQTLVSGKAYLVRVRTTASGLSLYRSSTANNWSRMLRTTSTQAPGSGDYVYALGEILDGTTLNAVTVTMDNTSDISFGSVHVGFYGNMHAATAASTTYYLNSSSGSIQVTSNGYLKIGDSSSPFPYSSVFSSSAINLMPRGKLTVYGTPRANLYATLTQDAVQGATRLYVSNTSGAAAGYWVYLHTPYTNVVGAYIIAGVGSNYINLTTSIQESRFYSGKPIPTLVYWGKPNISTPASIRIALLARTSSSDTQYYFDLRYCGIDYVDVYSSNSNCILYRCHGEAEDSGEISIQESYSGGPLTVSECFLPNSGVTTLNASAEADLSVTNCVLKSAALRAIPKEFKNNTATGSGGISTGQGGSYTYHWSNPAANAYDNNTSYYSVDLCAWNVSKISGWKCAGQFKIGWEYPVTIRESLRKVCTKDTLVLENFTIESSGGAPLLTFCSGSGYIYGEVALPLPSAGKIIFRNCTIARTFTVSYPYDSSLFTFNSPTYRYMGCSPKEIHFINCDFYGAEGEGFSSIISPYATNNPSTHNVSVYSDFTKIRGVSSIGSVFSEFKTVLCPLLTEGFWMKLCSFNGDRTLHVSAFGRQMVRGVDKAIYHTSSASERIIPALQTDNSLHTYACSSHRLIAVNTGVSKTVSVWVRKSSSADGEAYGGSQPKLVLKADASAGVTQDQILDTMTAGNGTWEQLSGTLPTPSGAPSVYTVQVECDGNTGWINVDDWSVS